MSRMKRFCEEISTVLGKGGLVDPETIEVAACVLVKLSELPGGVDYHPFIGEWAIEAQIVHRARCKEELDASRRTKADSERTVRQPKGESPAGDPGRQDPNVVERL